MSRLSLRFTLYPYTTLFRVLITTTPTGLTTSATKLTITTGGGANTVVNNIAFSSLTSLNWNTNKAQLTWSRRLNASNGYLILIIILSNLSLIDQLLFS